MVFFVGSSGIGSGACRWLGIVVPVRFCVARAAWLSWCSVCALAYSLCSSVPCIRVAPPCRRRRRYPPPSWRRWAMKVLGSGGVGGCCIPALGRREGGGVFLGLVCPLAPPLGVCVGRRVQRPCLREYWLCCSHVSAGVISSSRAFSGKAARRSSTRGVWLTSQRWHRSGAWLHAWLASG